MLATDIHSYHPEAPFLPGNWATNWNAELSVLIVDNFYQDPSKILSLARQIPFTNHPKFTSYAPVLRAVFFASMHAVSARLSQCIPAIPVGAEVNRFSYLNRQSKQMILEYSRYRCPHVDANTEIFNEWSIVVYLSDDNVGTEFFKTPKATTGCQTLISTPKFMEGWESTLRVAAKFNRAIIFPSANLYHKVDIDSVDQNHADFVRLFQTTAITWRETIP